jgi:hypothetical protein
LVPLKAGDVLFTDAPNAEVNDKMQFPFTISLHEPRVIEGKALIESLHQFAKLVDDTLTQFAPLL